MAHPALGRLWDRAQPCSDAWLDQLVALHPTFVLGYLPPGASQVWEGEPRWVVYDRVGDDAWRLAGRYRLARYEAEGKAALTPDRVAGCYAMIDGLHFIAAFPESQVGTEGMLHSLREQMAVTRAYKAQLDRGQDAYERAMIEEEYRTNARFRQDLMDKYEDVAPVFLTGRHSVCLDGWKVRPSPTSEGSYATADRAVS